MLLYYFLKKNFQGYDYVFPIIRWKSGEWLLEKKIRRDLQNNYKDMQR